MLIAWDHINSHTYVELQKHDTLTEYNPLKISKYNTDRIKESLLGRKILTELLHQLDIDLFPSMLQYYPSGKPYLNNGPYFSISHTHGMVIVCVSSNEVGIDIEQILPLLPPPLSMMNPRLLQLTGPENWLNAWVHQEAAAKMLGLTHLTEVLMIEWSNNFIGTYKQKRFRISPLNDLDNYYAAIAVPI